MSTVAWNGQGTPPPAPGYTPTIPNESGQASGSGGSSRQERRQARRAARRERRAERRNGEYKKGPLLEAESKGWAKDVLSGDFENNPWFHRLMDESELDPQNNPYLQQISEGLKGELQEDWLGNMRALDEQAEAAGRFGSGTWQAGRTRATEETQEALANALSQMYAGAYENARNRQAGVLGNLWQTQSNAARIPIEFGNLQVNKGQLGVARGQLGLARRSQGFSEKMQTAAAQSDALRDYFAIISGIGGLGGSQFSTTPGQYMPTQNPWAAGATAGVGGYLQAMQ